jgi:hypothetical protein
MGHFVFIKIFVDSKIIFLQAKNESWIKTEIRYMKTSLRE